MSLKHVRIELARDEQFPNGSRTRGYEFIAPLNNSNQLDAGEWKSARDKCRVKRFWEGEKPEIGRLVHKRGGTWAFDYDPDSSSDDEPGFKLDKHRFVPGEYVSFREHDGVMRTFRIVAVAELE